MATDGAAALRAAERMGDDAVRITIEVRASEYQRFLEEARELAVVATPSAVSWREKLWTVPPETRLTMREACEALNLSEPTVRKHMMNPTDPLPYRRIPVGRKPQVSFLVGELRTWLNAFEVR